jgi:hypothetical protein
MLIPKKKKDLISIILDMKQYDKNKRAHTSNLTQQNEQQIK